MKKSFSIQMQWECEIPGKDPFQYTQTFICNWTDVLFVWFSPISVVVVKAKFKTIEIVRLSKFYKIEIKRKIKSYKKHGKMHHRSRANK